MNIKPYDSDISTILSTGFYKIPRFQRPYSWDRGNIEDFWNDVFDGEKDSYFIGSMVFYRTKGQSEFNVVDGQQRLTTITIFLAALRDAMKQVGEEAIAQGVQGFIERKDLNANLRFVLLTETSYPFFQEHIQKFAEPDIDVEATPEEANLEGAYHYARERVDAVVAATQAQPGSKKSKAAAVKKYLQSMRDRLLALRAIIVELDNEDDAYIIFETLNTRGKDLEPADLVKTLITRLIPAASSDVDTTKDRWNKIRRQIWESEANLDLSTFIHHFWLAREDYTSKKMLFKRIKARIKKPDAKAFLTDLESGVPIYRRIFGPDEFDWAKEARPVKQSLKALHTFKISQPTPLTFSLLRAYYADQISLKQLRETLAAIENFHFMHTAIASISSSGGMSMMYAAAARELYSETDKQSRGKKMKEFRDKLKAKIPEMEVFAAGFMELQYTSTDTRNKALVRYVLGKVDEHFRNDKVVDYEKMTIEHIAPENPATPLGDNSYIGSIGNLIFVSGELNGKLENKAFKEKKKLMKDAGVPMDSCLTKARKWTEKEVLARAEMLTELSYSKVWKF